MRVNSINVLITLVASALSATRTAGASFLCPLLRSTGRALAVTESRSRLKEAFGSAT